MHQWPKIAIVGVGLNVALLGGWLWQGPVTGLIIGLAINVLAAPFARQLVAWVDGGAGSLPPATAETCSCPSSPAPKTGAAVTTLIFAATNIYSLLVVSIATATLVVSLDTVESQKQLAFTAAGYNAVQIYIIGAFTIFVWFQAITAVSLLLAGSQRRLRFVAFLAATVISEPLYLLLAVTGGLTTSLGHVVVPPSPQHLAGPAQFAVNGNEAFVIQFIVSLAWCVVVAFYAWALANIARFIRTTVSSWFAGARRAD